MEGFFGSPEGRGGRRCNWLEDVFTGNFKGWTGGKDAVPGKETTDGGDLDCITGAVLLSTDRLLRFAVRASWGGFGAVPDVRFRRGSRRG